MLNVFLSGQKYFGLEVFKMLMKAEGVTVSGVSAPAGDDRLFKRAWQLDVPVINAGGLNAENLPGGLDLIICAHSHDFISGAMLQKTKLGGIGYHPSLLPLHRGRDAVYWTIVLGDKVTGGSVYWLNDRVDGGPVAAQEWCFVRPGDKPFELWTRDLQPIGVRLFKQAIEDLQNGILRAAPQDNTVSTWEPSVGRPPLFRPDLLRLGPAPQGFRYENLKGRSLNAPRP